MIQLQKFRIATNKSELHTLENKGLSNSENDCYHLVQSLLSCHLQPKVKMKVHGNIILLFIQCEMGYSENDNGGA